MKVLKNKSIWNRWFFAKELIEQARKYKKMKTLLSKYNMYYDKIVNSKSLLELLEFHRIIWVEGFRNKNLGPCEWGCFRTSDIAEMLPEQVYLGNIYGLWTFNIPKWEEDHDEVMGPNGFGVAKDTKIYDLILDHYKCILKSNMNSIKSECVDFISEYESLNEQDDPYAL